MGELKGKKLGVLLTTAPAHPNFRPALALMNAAIEAGVRVYLYCVDEGVRSVAAPEVQALKERGAVGTDPARRCGRKYRSVCFVLIFVIVKKESNSEIII